MRYPAVLFAALALAACGKAPDARSDSQPMDPAVVEFLLASAASDFHAHRPPDLGPFLDVRAGYVKLPSGETQYMLCGRFLPAQHAGNTEGTPFVTIKTSGYEQYLGALGAAPYCERPSVIWSEEGDLSASLQGRLDSLRAAGGQAPPP